VPLSLNTRAVGEVTIIQCGGRIVAGGEAESLREHVCGLFQDHGNIVLHLGVVVFTTAAEYFPPRFPLPSSFESWPLDLTTCRQ
jgi:hypothetical protein